MNAMLNSLWNVLINHTEVQYAHENLSMVCLFTKPEKNGVTNWESLWREVTVSFQQLLPVMNSCQHIP